MMSSMLPLVSQVFDLLVSTSLRGGAVLALAALICLVLRGRPAAVRHAVWAAALGVFALLPVAVPVMPDWRIPAPASSALGSALSPTAQVEATIGRAHGVIGAVPTATPLRLPTARSLAVFIWAVIAVSLLVHAFASQFRLAALVRRSHLLVGEQWSAAMTAAARAVSLQRPVPVRVSSELSLPIVAGVTRPCVVLPESARAWDRETLHQVLLHELAHVRRSDLAWLTVSRLISACFWFHPLVWYAGARLRSEAEQSCDDFVLHAGERASGYASLLLSMADSGARPAPAAGIAVLTHERLSERIESILEPKRSRRGASRWVLASVAVAAGLVAGVVAAPQFGPARASEPLVRQTAQLRPERETPLRPMSASIRVRTLSGGRTRLDAPELEVQNQDSRAIQAVQLRLHTPGVSDDRIWSQQHITAGSRAVIRVPAEKWSQDMPRSKAAQLEVSISAVRFEGEPAPSSKQYASQSDARAPRATPSPSAVETPAPPAGGFETPSPTPTPRAEPAPKAAPGKGGYTPAPPPPSGDVVLYRGDGPRVQATVWNPPDAPVVIGDAWVPRDAVPPSESEAGRAFDRGHDVTWIPGLSLHNTTDRRVVALRLRYKADPEAHAVSGFSETIEPGQWLFLLPRSSMWGKPEAMTVQVLGVRFEDGRTWGSMGSTIDARQWWIR